MEADTAIWTGVILLALFGLFFLAIFAAIVVFIVRWMKKKDQNSN